MSMPTLFFTAAGDDARSVRLNHALPPEDVEELGDIDSLKMSILWALIDGRDWDVDMPDQFAEVYSASDECLHRLPHELVHRLLKLDPVGTDAAAAAWAETEEMACEPAEARAVIEAAIRIASRAESTKRGMFLYSCL